jgi:hypothetical protein
LSKGGAKLDIRLSGRDASTGKTIELRPAARDNGDGTYDVSYVLLSSAGTYLLDVRDATSGQRIPPTPSVVVVSEPTMNEQRAAFDVAQSTVDIAGLMLPPMMVGRAATLTILARNRAGALMHTGGMLFDVLLVGPIDAEPAKQRTTRGRVVDNLDGTYTARLVAIAGAGTYQLDVLAPGVNGTVAPTPTTIDVGAASTLAGVFSPLYTTAAGAGLASAAAGRRAEFSIVARDAYGVQLPSGGLVITSQISDATGVAREVTIVDNNDGTYAAHYEIPSGEAGDYDLQVTVNDIDSAIDIVTRKVRVNAVGTGLLAVEKTLAVGSGLVFAVVGQTASFSLVLRDAAGLPFGQANSVPVVVELTGPGVVGALAARVVSSDVSSFNVSYIVPTSGSFKLSITIAGQALPSSPYDIVAVTSAPMLATASVRREQTIERAMSDAERMVAAVDTSSASDVEAVIGDHVHVNERKREIVLFLFFF